MIFVHPITGCTKITILIRLSVKITISILILMIVTSVYLISSAFSEYLPPLHVYILTIKPVQLANMEPLDDPIKYLGIVG